MPLPWNQDMAAAAACPRFASRAPAARARVRQPGCPYTGTPLSVLSGIGGEQVLLSGKGVFSVNPDNAPFRTLELVLLPGNDAFL